MAERTGETVPLEDVQFFGEVMTAMVTSSQKTTNRIQAYTEEERDKAQEFFVALWHDLAHAHEASPVQIRAVTEVLDKWWPRVAQVDRSIEFRASRT